MKKYILFLLVAAMPAFAHCPGPKIAPVVVAPAPIVVAPKLAPVVVAPAPIVVAPIGAKPCVHKCHRPHGPKYKGPRPHSPKFKGPHPHGPGHGKKHIPGMNRRKF